MSIIMPSGANKADWSSTSKDLVKTAGSEEAPKDELLEAATAYLGELGEKETEEGADDSTDVIEEAVPSEVVVEVSEEDEAGEADEAEIVLEDAEADGVVTEVEEEDVEVEAKDAIDEAVIEIQEAVENIQEAISVSDEAEVAEDVSEEVSDEIVEVEISDETDFSDEVAEVRPACGVAKSEEVDIPGVADDQDMVEVEKETSTCAGSKGKTTKEASSGEEFLRYAALSPKNKEKLKDYWVNYVGYPKDYCDIWFDK